LRKGGDVKAIIVPSPASERFIGPYCTSDGRLDKNIAQHAVDAVATELGVAAASVDQMYQPAL
jgi:hypothetical protein